MAPSDFPAEWTDPRYVATIVGVLATTALCVYASVPESTLTTAEITLVLLVILVPAGVVYELAERAA